ncbi:hypothetical protein [Vreelandella zhanjiangensis]|uniref:hypothetical protein n=1 Tax=Vreelandella zhanjiangensis TaxID=1121960 RepID=UPI000377661A|nr:hypothetical protein [Halomonas zhanjiangensis]
MINQFAVPGFLSFGLGALLTFLINIDSDNVAIMTAALIAALLTYYNSLVTVHNKKKDYRERVTENIVMKGREFIERTVELRVKAISYMPLKKEYEDEVQFYKEELNKLKFKVSDIETNKVKIDKSSNDLDEAYKKLNFFRDKYFSDYDKSRSKLNENLVFFGSLKLDCENKAEVLLDEIELLDNFYLSEKKSKQSLAEDIVINIADTMKSLKDEATAPSLYKIDSSLINDFSAYEVELRDFLNLIRMEVLNGVTVVDKAEEKERNDIFKLTVVVFLIGIGFMVSNGFKVLGG